MISSNVYTVNYGFAAIYYVFHSTYRNQFRFGKSAVMFCSLSAHSPHSKCGNAKIEDKNAVSVPLLSCTKDVTSYLRSLGVSGSRGRQAHAKVTELDLILNRAGLLVINDEDIEKNDNMSATWEASNCKLARGESCQLSLPAASKEAI